MCSPGKNDELQFDDMAANSTNEVMIWRHGAGFCAICCRPWTSAQGGYEIGVQEPLPDGHDSNPAHRIQYSVRNRWWTISQSFKSKVLPSITYTLDTSTGCPCFFFCMDCLIILARFIATRVDRLHRCRPGEIHDPETLYTHLQRQFLKDSKGQNSAARLLWSHNGFIDDKVEWSWNEMALEWVTDRQHSWLQSLASGPIPSLSSYIISQLKPLASDSARKVSFLIPREENCPQATSKICQIPTEITAMIVRYLDLPSVFNLRETSHHFAERIELNQWFWFSRFINKELFGFIFTHASQDVIADIEAKVIRRGLLPGKMDWMRLIKELSSFTSFTGSGCFHNAPPAFRNRRRIWKILETMETDWQESLVENADVRKYGLIESK